MLLQLSIFEQNNFEAVPEVGLCGLIRVVEVDGAAVWVNLANVSIVKVNYFVSVFKAVAFGT